MQAALHARRARGAEVATPASVSRETIAPELRLRSPYRGVVTGREILRLRVRVAPRGVAPQVVIVDVDDLAVEVWGDGAPTVVGAGAIDALFVVERQPRHGFLTWFGVFVRQRGRADCLLVETPDGPVARYVERAIEDRLGLGDEPVRGELRIVR
jgi:hypothetical protein